MIYPKFPRRTLALILSCLVITLGAVGVLFLVYFFNESSTLSMDSSLKGVYSDQNKNPQFKKNVVSNNQDKFERKFTNKYGNDYKENTHRLKIRNNKNTLIEISDKDVYFSTPSGPKLTSNYENQGFLFTKILNPNGLRDSNSNSETIYIDDFDRSNYNSKSKYDLSNTEYFDTIIVDHKNDIKENENDHSLHDLHKDLSKAPIEYENNFLSKVLRTKVGNEGNLKVNSKRKGSETHWNKIQLLSYVKIAEKKLSDEKMYSLDLDSPGSGSGDYNDDTEINEIMAGHLPKKIARDNDSKPVNRSYAKSSHTRWRYPNNFLRDNSNFVSLPPVLTTSSSVDEQSFTTWVSKKLKKISLNPTRSSKPNKQVYNPSIKTSHSFSKLTNKKLVSPTINTNHRQLQIKESNNLIVSSPTSLFHNIQPQFEIDELGSTETARFIKSSLTKSHESDVFENNAWMETRTRRIMGNVKKSEERSRQLLLCEEAGGGELCRMLFKGHIND